MPEERATENLTELKRKLSALAMDIAEAFGIDLDHSLSSVEHVEEILGQLHDEYQKTGNDDGLAGVALECGAYIIEVIERNYESGTWKRDHGQFGNDSFPYEWRGSTIFPYGWCMKRIFDGPGDDVWVKFQSIVMRNGTTG